MPFPSEAAERGRGGRARSPAALVVHGRTDRRPRRLDRPRHRRPDGRRRRGRRPGDQDPHRPDRARLPGLVRRPLPAVGVDELRRHDRPRDLPRRRRRQARHRDPARADQHRLLPSVGSSSGCSVSATSASSRPARRGAETFEDVRKPALVQNEIYRQMEANATRMHGPRLVPGRHRRSRTRASSIPAQLDQLDDLRKRGVITEAEFAAKKAELLNRM